MVAFVHPPFDAQIPTLDVVLVDRLFGVRLVYGENVISEHLWFLCGMLHTLPLTNACPAQQADIYYPRCSDDKSTITKNIGETLKLSISMYPTCVRSAYPFLFHY